MNQTEFDLCVIGGGINGTGIARDAAGRGLSVLLIEANDLASATSSASTKLIHGGLRYLEHYEFGLVRDSLKERETLMQMAPHIIWPIIFVLPHNQDLRPALLIRLGLFLYDHLGGRKKLSASKSINFKTHKYGDALKSAYTKGFSYADCWVDDARLVILNAMDAKNNGATILTNTSCTSLHAKDGSWVIKTQDYRHNQETYNAKIVVNATGPWAYEFLEKTGLSNNDTPKIRLVKGSHIIVPKLFEGEHAYILQQPDKRIVFSIPYEDKYTLIGTTDVDYEDEIIAPKISEEEIDYLCEAINRSFKKSISSKHIIWAYSGVRPLIEDESKNASSVTRDYKIIEDKSNGPLLLSVFGGKITTYRVLSEKVVNLLTDKPAWTEGAKLPGGNIHEEDIESFIYQKQQQYPFIENKTLRRFAKTYGNQTELILKNAKDIKDLGRDFGEGVYDSEINYLIENEWALSIEDILLRRTKLGLHLKEETIQNIESYLSAIPKKANKNEQKNTASN
jgi:glycerol-3-phosphate dehydrogenase